MRGHDVIIRHIRIRTGVSGQGWRSGWEADAFSTVAAYNVIVDHCTLTWALDENLSASGPRFEGRTVADWRRGTSHDITFSYNLAAEGIAEGSHPKGEHSKGSLIHDNVTNILIYRNIYAHNMERSPLLKGGVHAAVVNNLIFDPGTQAIHYNLMDLEWADHPHRGRLALGGRQRAARRLLDPAGRRLPHHRRGRRPALFRPRQCRGRPPGPAAADVRPLHDERGAGSSRSRGRTSGRRALPCFRRTRSRPTCSAMPARAPGTATRRISG